jgi:hypothetical protein
LFDAIQSSLYLRFVRQRRVWMRNATPGEAMPPRLVNKT